MHPFIQLMRTYCIDYTNSHDQTLYDEIMEPDYVLHTMGFTLTGRDEAYAPAVTNVFRQYPGLGLLVHELVLNGDRLCMRFSEHGASIDHDQRVSVWRGVGLYKWNGSRLVENYVEQDYYGQQRQLSVGSPNPVDAPHIDPWMSTRPVAEDASVVATTRQWLEAGDLTAADGVVIDDSDTTGRVDGFIDVEHVTINDIFSAGPRVAFHVTFHGPYRGGLDGVDDGAVGRPIELHAAGTADVTGAAISNVRAVTGKLGVVMRLANRST